MGTSSTITDFLSVPGELFAVLGEGGAFTWVCERWPSDLGFDPAELIGAPASRILHPDEGGFIERVGLAGLDGQVVRVVDADGRAHPSRWSARGREGSWHLRISLGRTTTDEDARRMLTIGERMLGAGHFSIDLRTGETHSSAELFRLYGRDPIAGSLPVNEALQRFHPDDRERFLEALQRAGQHDGMLDVEGRVLREDTGEVVHVRAQGRPYGAGPDGIFGVFQDISQEVARRRTLDELRRASELAFETTLAAHWDWDLRTNQVVWSRRFFEMIALDHETDQDSSDLLFRRLHPEDAPRVEAAVQAHLADNTRYDLEFRLRNDAPDRDWVWVRATGQAVRDGSGAPVRMIGAMIDVPDTHDALQSLREQVRRAEAASRAKSEFMANVSHEIRTPMNAILGLAELLSLTELDAEQRDALADMTTASRTLLRLIDDLLDLAKAESGRLELAPTAVDLAGLLTDVVRLHRGRAIERGLDLVLDLELPADTRVLCDGERLKQVLGNLIGNAIKFTPDGRVTLRARGEVRGDASALSVVLDVRDTGPGIPEALRARLFQPFEQLDASSTRRHGGVGLGLAICRELVERMHGTLDALDAPDGGTLMRLRLQPPRVDSTDADPASLAPTDEEVGVDCRVLLVEDNPINQRVALAMLQRLGCSVQVAQHGAEALVRTSRHAFDLVLMDVQMPVMDGLTATRRLREQGVTVPIVGLTAHALASDRQRCLDAGMDEHLTKPVSLESLGRALRRCQAC